MVLLLPVALLDQLGLDRGLLVRKQALRSNAMVRFGCAAIMACQQVSLGLNKAALVGGSRVESSADLARLIRSRPELAKATIVADRNISPKPCHVTSTIQYI
ncbi:hypothetical protein [Rhizobium leguminosarum]|uniref:hypothetical protein n=1 Tax=Rhizobium leguminosarum TaxID=384 RepID=UPI001954DE36|nr:hypothetical protein [Rhizobium leguminosarum]